MRLLVLGHGKTGKLVAEVAHERGHGVHVLDAKENRDATALTPPFVAGFDVVIDFTTPEAVLQNMRACLATGARMVIGTTGWYDKLADMRGLAERKECGAAVWDEFLGGRAADVAAGEADGRGAEGCGVRVFDRGDAPHDEAGLAERDGGHAGEVVKAASGSEGGRRSRRSARARRGRACAGGEERLGAAAADA